MRHTQRQEVLRAMRAVGRSLDAEAAALKRDEVAQRTLDTLSGEDRRKAARRSTSRSAASAATAWALPGLEDLIELPHLPFATLRPPYQYQWTWTKRIYIAPGKLTAYAHNTTGRFGFDIESDHDSNQLNKCKARAAVGVSWRPTERGLLGIRPQYHADEDWYLKWNMRVAHAYAWLGILVQSYDAATNALASTPIDDKGSMFNKSGGGSVLPPAEFNVVIPDGEPWGTSLFVDPNRWYAIWIWCGGGIRAAGWQTYLGMNVGSDAESQLDIQVPSIALYFTPMAKLVQS